MTQSAQPLSSREQFRFMLQNHPRLAHYWNEQDDCLRYVEMKEGLGVLSHGEQIMARFYMSVWRHKNHDFDILDAAAMLDTRDKKIILSWFADPFWP